MLKKIGQVILNNFGLKVLAVIFAVVLWLAIVNVADPDMSATFTIPVQIENADYLAEQGKTYEILDNTGEITFTVEGPRSYVEELSEENFSATANLEDINSSMTEVDIDLSVDSRYRNRVEITNRQSTLVLQVEDLVTEEFDIEVAIDDTPAADYFVESAQAEPSVVTVTGAQSKVEQIESAQARVSVAGAEEDFTSEEAVLLLDDHGAELDEDQLTVDVVETEVSVKIFMEKIVPLRFGDLGEPAEGYWAGTPECDVDSVVIAGEESAIRDVEEIVLDSKNLSVENAQRDVTAEVDISSVLPSGVTLVEDEPDSIEVTIPVVQAFITEVEMPTGNLTFTDLADDLTLTTPEDSVTVRITGPEDVIGSVNGNRLKGTVDVSGLGVGSFNLPIDVETEGAYDADAAVSVNITRTE